MVAVPCRCGAELSESLPVIGHRHIADLDSRVLLIPLEKAKKRGTVEVASRLQQYMGSIMRDAKRAQLIG